jgi:hypothetical protein
MVFAVHFSLVRMDAANGGVMVMKRAILILTMALGGCGLSTPSIDTPQWANEKARYQCELAQVPVRDMPSCIVREVQSRRDNSWFGPGLL